MGVKLTIVGAWVGCVRGRLVLLEPQADNTENATGACSASCLLGKQLADCTWYSAKPAWL